jgi:hypothetical protein
MKTRASLFLGLLATTFILTAGIRDVASARMDPEGLIAHEWGTFTTVAGVDGRAADWLPLGGPADLPCFVERYKNRGAIKGLRANVTTLTYEAARASLWGKVRMETPVLYFYSPRPVSADVRITFPRGLMTEWYPKAAVTQHDVATETLRLRGQVSAIEWRDVKIRPQSAANFLTEPGESHYYAARDTDAAPLSVAGQQEKFLFYRGVADFDVPISAKPAGAGAVRVRNLGTRGLRGVILFQNTGGRLSYRVHGTLEGEATIAAPIDTAEPSSIRADLERILVSAGLYQKEARAMVATWRDAWFEEGVRVFYVLSPADVDAILPLTIDPAPVQVARVFVGRMEVITPALAQSVRTSIAANDAAALARHARFLGPIAERLIATGASDAESARIKGVTNTALTAYAAAPTACR